MPVSGCPAAGVPPLGSVNSCVCMPRHRPASGAVDRALAPLSQRLEGGPSRFRSARAIAWLERSRCCRLRRDPCRVGTA